MKKGALFAFRKRRLFHAKDNPMLNREMKRLLAKRSHTENGQLWRSQLQIIYRAELSETLVRTIPAEGPNAQR